MWVVKVRAAFSGGSSEFCKLLWEALYLIGNMKHRLAMAEEYLRFDGLEFSLLRFVNTLKCCKEKANTF